MCWVFQQFGGNAGQRRTFLSHKGALAGTPHLFNIPFIFQIKILSLQQTGCLIFPSFLQFYSCLLVFLKFSNFVPVFSQKWNFKPSYKPLKEKHWYSLKYNNNASVSSIFISVLLICTFLLPRHTFERKSAGFFFLFFFFNRKSLLVEKAATAGLCCGRIPKKNGWGCSAPFHWCQQENPHCSSWQSEGVSAMRDQNHPYCFQTMGPSEYNRCCLKGIGARY